MRFLNKFFKKKITTYTPIKSIGNDDVVPGETVNALILADEILHTNNVERLNEKYLLKINSDTVKKYSAYDVPQIKNKITQQYENLDKQPVYKGNCPVCRGRLENQKIITIEFRKERENMVKLDIIEAIALVSFHPQCVTKYDLEDIAIANKD